MELWDLSETVQQAFRRTWQGAEDVTWLKEDRRPEKQGQGDLVKGADSIQQELLIDPGDKGMPSGRLR